MQNLPETTDDFSWGVDWARETHPKRYKLPLSCASTGRIKCHKVLFAVAWQKSWRFAYSSKRCHLPHVSFLRACGIGSLRLRALYASNARRETGSGTRDTSLVPTTTSGRCFLQRSCSCGDLANSTRRQTNSNDNLGAVFRRYCRGEPRT